MTRHAITLMWVLVCQFATAVSAQVGNAPITAAPSSVGNIIAMQPLAGALFFTGDQRERMNRARTHGTSLLDGVPAQPAPSVLNGFVKRSDGQSAVWVDGQMRVNIQSGSARTLQPGDVGGESKNPAMLIRDSTSQPAKQMTRTKSTQKTFQQKKKVLPRSRAG